MLNKNTTEANNNISDALAAVNNTWHISRPTADLAVIFVHGYMSDSRGCWLNKNGTYWPSIVANDARIGASAVFLGGYYTNVDSLDYGISDCANELFSGLNVPSGEHSRAPLDFKNIIFVCHSLGGIVTRYMLESRQTAFAGKSVGLVLVASPSLGSAYADVLGGIAEIFGNRTGRQLRKSAELLVDLDQRFKVLVEERKLFLLAGLELIETQGYLHTKIFQLLSPIVSASSAARYFGRPTRVPGTNHSNIAKPLNAEHPSHRYLLNFIQEKFEKIKQPFTLLSPTIETVFNTEISKKPTLRTDTSKILFEVYDISCTNFYFERPIDVEISQLSAFYSIWLSGPSGTGKTSIIKHLLGKVDNAPIEISLSHLVGNLNVEDCIAEIFDTCLQLEIGKAQKSVSKLLWLSDTLAKHSTMTPIVLYLDEVPINNKNSAELQSFVGFIANLLNSVKQRSGAGTQFIISSIESPRIDLSEKFKEQMIFRSLDRWSNEELRGLYKKISGAMPSLEIQEPFLGKLIDHCEGSPRILKDFFRRRAAGNVKTQDMDSLLNLNSGKFF